MSSYVFKIKEVDAACSHQPSLFNVTNEFQLTTPITCSDGHVSFLRAVFSPVLSLMSARQTAWVPFRLEGKMLSFNRAETGHLLAVGGHVEALSTENQ